jgi:hypothetical protein
MYKAYHIKPLGKSKASVQNLLTLADATIAMVANVALAGVFSLQIEASGVGMTDVSFGAVIHPWLVGSTTQHSVSH